MSTQQPEALRLAKTTPSLRGGDWGDRAVAELRRLHALNAELLEALIDVRDNAASDSPEMWGRVDAAIAKAGGREA